MTTDHDEPRRDSPAANRPRDRRRRDLRHRAIDNAGEFVEDDQVRTANAADMRESRWIRRSPSLFRIPHSALRTSLRRNAFAKSAPKLLASAQRPIRLQPPRRAAEADGGERLRDARIGASPKPSITARSRRPIAARINAIAERRAGDRRLAAARRPDNGADLPRFIELGSSTSNVSPSTFAGGKSNMPATCCTRKLL